MTEGDHPWIGQADQRGRFGDTADELLVEAEGAISSRFGALEGDTDTKRLRLDARPSMMAVLIAVRVLAAGVVL